MKNLLMIAVMVLTAVVTKAAVINVPADQPTIQAGINAASTYDRVSVATGTYYEYNITMKSGVRLMSAAEDADSVIIDAQQQGRVIICQNVESATITGLTITGGVSTRGGGMLCDSSWVLVEYCVFLADSSSEVGGAVYCKDSTFAYAFNFCTFDSNKSQSGGAVFLDTNVKASFYGSIFDANTAFGQGGAISTSMDCDLNVTNCTFYQNSAPSGGSIYCGTVTPMPVTLLDNIFSDGLAGGVFNWAAVGSSPSITCCDLWNNAGGNWVGPLAGLEVNSGNFSADPLFCDTIEGDFHIKNQSPCISASFCGGDLVGALGVGVCQTGIDADFVVNQLPVDFELTQNYPNPFNPTTTIEYYLPRRSHVELTVHNLLGRKVATLVNETQPYGPQIVTWNGKDSRGNTVASGVYLYRIKTDSFTESRKMVLLK